jgi:hypothetical protein
LNYYNRTITIWNSLPDNVASSTSINKFKNTLDKFLHAQDVYFNWKADLTGTGDQSKTQHDTNFDHLKFNSEVMTRI